jgi:hypothetical protein
MLSNFDIEKLCLKLDLPLVGVFQKDTLVKVPKQIGSYYINQQSSTDGDGTHWTMFKIYCDEERDDDFPAILQAKALYFDPFGLDMSVEVADYLADFKPIPYNNKQIQNVRSESCGWYCVACDYILEHKKHSDTYLEDFELFLQHFRDNPTKNQALLKEIFKPL